MHAVKAMGKAPMLKFQETDIPVVAQLAQQIQYSHAFLCPDDAPLLTVEAIAQALTLFEMTYFSILDRNALLVAP